MNMLEIVQGNLDKLVEERRTLSAELDTITEDRDAFGDAEAARGDEIVARLTAIGAEEDQLRSRISELEDIARRNEQSKETQTRAPRFNRLDEGRDIRSYSRDEARGAALEILERDGRNLKAHQQDHFDMLVRKNTEHCDGDYIARRAVITMSEAYRTAFWKSAYGVKAFDPDEQRALAAYAMNEMRAGSHTTTAGGFGVPVLIDPSIILTSGAADVPLLRYCRIENITTDVWKGVSSTAPAWSVVAEGAASTDAFPTLAQPIVTTYTARTFLPFSVEISQDYPSFEAEFQPLIAQGYTDYLSAKTMTGSGSDIQGVFTALDAVSASEVTVTTDGQLGAVDFRKLYANVPERFRANSTWVFSVSVENVARSFSPNGMGSDFTVNMSAAGVPQIFSKDICLSDYAPAFTGTTGAANIAILMDLRHYVFARRVGMSVELVPHLFDVTNNMPTLSRGWLAYARAGGNVVAANAGRLLQNT